MTIARSPAVGAIYESTSVNLTCTAILPVEVDSVITVIANWTDPDGQQIHDTNRVTILPPLSIEKGEYKSILLFYPVDDTDEGLYKCQMTVLPVSMDENGSLLETSSNISIEITVQCKIVLESAIELCCELYMFFFPSPVLPNEFPVIIVSNGLAQVGETFNLTCHVTTVDGLVAHVGVDYNITWTKKDIINEEEVPQENMQIFTQDGTNANLKLVFDPLRFQDRGAYVCAFQINITLTGDYIQGFGEYDINVDCK